jgi:hypothetical protein
MAHLRLVTPGDAGVAETGIRCPKCGSPADLIRIRVRDTHRVVVEVRTRMRCHDPLCVPDTP